MTKEKKKEMRKGSKGKSYAPTAKQKFDKIRQDWQRPFWMWRREALCQESLAKARVCHVERGDQSSRAFTRTTSSSLMFDLLKDTFHPQVLCKWFNNM